MRDELIGSGARSHRLRGTRVIVAGAGLAGLAAARALEADGAEVVVIEARDRVGGRVWTIRDAFGAGQHAEAGADLIEADQSAILGLARQVRLRTTTILRRGFGYYGPTRSGGLAIQSQHATFRAIAPLVAPLVRDYRIAEQRWDGGVAAWLGATSVAEWLREHRAKPWLVERFRALRGLFLADPEDLSLLALVDFFAADGQGPGKMMRLTAGNDALATRMARQLRNAPELRTVLRRVRQDATGVVATVESPQGVVQRRADVLVCAVPAITLRDVAFEPALPAMQQTAIHELKYGAATRALLQFERPFWRRARRPSAFGTAMAIGAVWDGNEQQRRGPAILSLLAGGGGSAALSGLLATEGVEAVAARLRWLGRPTRVVSSWWTRWEEDPWARGGYAFFSPSFRPEWRDLLARPAGRVLFAGEHTSVRWQGYMNGAIETGQRAAAEVRGVRS